MPSSPLDLAKAEGIADPEHVFRKGLRELDELLDRGVGLSGQERNCAFLNVPGAIAGGRRFAIASAVMGLDVDDDARAAAVVDWDEDGDLDLWTSNRTAPMARFFRNDTPAGQAWLALRLRGTASNRDAIGARVVVELDDGRKLRRVLKAGEGYLGQSSHWLHFGGGSAKGIRSVVIHWPGSKSEQISGVSLGARFEVAQGGGKATPIPAKAVTIPDGEPPPAEESGPAHALTASRSPLPQLPYKTFDGQEKLAGGAGKSSLLVNLWATWCVPCAAELKALAEGQRELQRAKVRVLALSVDGLVEGAGETSEPASFFAKRKLPFEGGLATPELLTRLEAAYTQLFSLRWPTSLPTSVLLDEQGAILAYYRGPVEMARVVREANLRGESTERFHDRALPFPGRWFKRPQPLEPLEFALDLMERGQVEAAEELTQRAHARYLKSPEYPKLLTWISDESMKANRPAEALANSRRAVEAAPDNAIALNNLAWHLATHADPAVRDPNQAVRLAEKAATLTKAQDPSVLDTLAAAYHAAGRSKDAVATAERALKIAVEQKNAEVEKGLREALERYRTSGG